MSELISLIVRRQRWPERCVRLVYEWRLHRLGLSPRDNAVEDSRKLLCPVPLATRSVFRHLAWWNSIGIRLPSVQARGASRSSPSAPKQKGSVPESEQAFNTDYRELQAVRRAEASICLQDLCGFSEEEAEEHVKNLNGFSVLKDLDIRKNYKMLVDFGFLDKVIKENPAALTMPVDILLAKIRLMNFMKWGDINDTFPFFRLNTTTLRKVAGMIKAETTSNGGSNRITLLAEKLQCPPMQVSQIVAKHGFLQSMPLTKMEHVLKIMLDAQVSREDILNDMWALRYNANVIREKLQRVTDAGVTPLKPWMIRCPEETLSRRIRKETRRRSVLGESGTIVEYLEERLQCGREEVNEVTSKYPRILQLSGPKIKEVIDFLLENGYTVEDIRKMPKILFHSIETMKDRLVELKKYNHKSESLMPLCKSRQQYEQYLQRVVYRRLESFTPSK